MLGEITTPVKALAPKERQNFNAKCYPVDIGARIAAIRGKMTQRELARLAKVDPGTISRIERGEYDPTISTLEKITSALGLSIEAFFGGAMPIGAEPSPSELQRFERELDETRSAVRALKDDFGKIRSSIEALESLVADLPDLPQE